MANNFAEKISSTLNPISMTVNSAVNKIFAKDPPKDNNNNSIPQNEKPKESFFKPFVNFISGDTKLRTEYEG